MGICSLASLSVSLSGAVTVAEVRAGEAPLAVGAGAQFTVKAVARDAELARLRQELAARQAEVARLREDLEALKRTDLQMERRRR